MKFNEKLDFLMNLTNTSNVALGNITAFDSSYISRIRSAKRGTPKDPEFFKITSSYFIKKAQQDYQKAVLAEALSGEGPLPRDAESAEALLEKWLQNDDDNPSITASHLSELLRRKGPDSNSEPLAKVQFYYGNEGKRHAVEVFLGTLGKISNPPELLLYSNEDFSWLYEDPVFAKKWAMLLTAYLKQGGKIKIIHTITRDANEMVEALAKWLPVYFTGRIEPYFYPKLQDRLFRRTMFIAKGHSAIISNSVGEETSDAVTMLTCDYQAVNGFENEYMNFFRLCKPLMDIYTDRESDKLKTQIAALTSEKGTMVKAHTLPGLYLMPENILNGLKAKYSLTWIDSLYEKSRASYAERNADRKPTIEILNLPPADKLDEVLPYSRDEYILHLKSLVDEMKKNPLLTIIPANSVPLNTLIYLKEDKAVFIIKTDTPEIGFHISDQRMVSAFWESLERMSSSLPERTQVIALIEKYIESII